VTGDNVVAKNDEEEATFKQYKRFDKHPGPPPAQSQVPGPCIEQGFGVSDCGVVMEKMYVFFNLVFPIQHALQTLTPFQIISRRL
jgi:hypothetical protein